MDAERVSVIIPVRNGMPFILEAVASALAQGSIVADVIVADDGSTDNTVEALRGLDDQRLTVCANRGRGVSSARNSAAAMASGAWLLFLDADDRLVPGAVKTLVDGARPEAAAVYGDYDRVDGNGRRMGQRHLMRRWRRKPSGDILRAIAGGNFIGVGCLAVRRTVFERIGGFLADLRLCEDWLMWCRIAAAGPVDHRRALHVMDIRIHPGSTMHRAPYAFCDFAPVIDHVFGDPLIRSRLDPDEVPGLRARAEQSLRFYALTEAVRMGAWRRAADEFAAATRHQPREMPRLAVRLAASMAGI